MFDFLKVKKDTAESSRATRFSNASVDFQKIVVINTENKKL